jgi:hypothetical protein
MRAACFIVADNHDMAAAQLRHPLRQLAVLAGGVADRQGDGKQRALAERALDLDAAVHQADQVMDDGQAEAAAAKAPAHAVIGLTERREDVAQCLVADTDAGVANVDVQMLLAIGPPGRAARDAHAALGGELDGIVDQVGDDLAEPVLVAQYEFGQRRVDVEPQVQALLAGGRGKGMRHLADHLAEIEGQPFELQAAGFDAREIENVVEQEEQGIGRTAQGGELAMLLGRQSAAGEQVGNADDAVHRGADFVAHVGQEGTLGTVGPLGRFLGEKQFLGPLVDLVFEVLAMVGQFGIAVGLYECPVPYKRSMPAKRSRSRSFMRAF